MRSARICSTCLSSLLQTTVFLSSIDCSLCLFKEMSQIFTKENFDVLPQSHDDFGTSFVVNCQNLSELRRKFELWRSLIQMKENLHIRFHVSLSFDFESIAFGSAFGFVPLCLSRENVLGAYLDESVFGV